MRLKLPRKKYRKLKKAIRLYRLKWIRLLKICRICFTPFLMFLTMKFPKETELRITWLSRWVEWKQNCLRMHCLTGSWLRNTI